MNYRIYLIELCKKQINDKFIRLSHRQLCDSYFYIGGDCLADIADKILKAIEIIIDKKLGQLGFDRTVDGKIIEKTEKGYLVAIEGGKIEVKLNGGEFYAKGDTVKVRIPQNNINQAYIEFSAYPVGAIYLSVDGTDPSKLFGGVWERIEDRFLLASGKQFLPGYIGGEAQHTLSISEMPSHIHNANYNWTSSNGTQTPVWAINMSPNTGDGIGSWPSANGAGDTGGSQPHNNMPPYLSVYVWKRIK